MAHPTSDVDREPDDELTPVDTPRTEEPPEQPGDILGISHATGQIPHEHVRPGGHPEGIDVRDPDATRDLPQTPGATSIDMGAGGEGNAIKRSSH
jgi:hypothetical protein